MRILYILSGTSKAGGATKSFMALLNGVIKAEHEVAVVTPNTDGVYNDLKKLNVKTYVIPFSKSIYPVIYRPKTVLAFLPRLCSTLVQNTKARPMLLKVVREFSPDIIHSNSSVIGISFDVARKCGIPHLYHFREYGDKDFSMHYFPSRKSLLRKISVPQSYNICITKGIQDYNHFDNLTCSRVIYNGISLQKDAVKGSQEKQCFLFAGRLETTKGVFELVKAYKEYLDLKPAKVYPLWIAGRNYNPNYVSEVKKYISANGLESHVSFLGEREEMASLYGSALALIVPSAFEGFGRSMPEAMFNSCLCIGRNTGGTKEQFDNGLKLTGQEIGLRFESESQLASIMKNVSESSYESYQSMITSALRTVNSLYSIESYASNVMAFYDEILKKK